MKFRNLLPVLVLAMGFSSRSQAQLFTDSTVINSDDRSFGASVMSEDYMFVQDLVNDSIYVIDLDTKSIISSTKANSDMVRGGMQYWEGYLVLVKDYYSVELYNVSDIHNINYLSTFTALKGLFRSDHESGYFYWLEHWNKTMKIVDFSTGNMLVKSSSSTGGNAQGAARIGTDLFIGNAYHMSKKVDITDLTNPVYSDFGNNGSGLQCSDNYVIIHDHFGGDVASIWDIDGNKLDSKSPVAMGLGTRDNFNFIYDDGDYNLYDISSGSFLEYLATVPYTINSYNEDFWISILSNKIMFFPRVPCGEIIIKDTVCHYISNEEFELESPKVYYERTDLYTTGQYGCDSLIERYTKYIFEPNYCTDTLFINDTLWVQDTVIAEVFDTTYITVYDSITVTDTLLVDVTFTSNNEPGLQNTIKVYPNPAKDILYINTGQYHLMENHKIKITDTRGRIVFEEAFNSSEFTIPINDFGETGLYFLLILNEDSSVISTKKIVLE